MCSKSGEGNMAWAFVRKIELPSPNSIPATHLAVSVASLSLSLSLSLSPQQLVVYITVIVVVTILPS